MLAWAEGPKLSWGLASLGILTVLVVAALAPPALAAPPANDNFPGTTLSGLPTSATGTNVEATLQAGEPNHAGDAGGASVWWSWTAPSSGTVVIDTCDSTFDTLLAVYTGGTVGSLTEVASNDTSCGGQQSKVSFAASAGTVYRIAVDGFFADQGSIDLDITPPPANDNFPGMTLSGLPTSATGTNAGATAQAGEPNHQGATGGASLWYSWTAPSTGKVAIDTCDSDFDVLLGVYTGSAVGSLIEVASDTDACGLQPKVSFVASAGTVYRIAVDGYFADEGNVDLEIRVPPPPANDNFPGTTLSGLPSSATGTNIDATKQAGEPNHAGNSGGASVWYSWTAPSTGHVTIDTCDSLFDTLLAVYTGTTVNSLTPVTSNDDNCGRRSQVSFAATAGTVYRIAVDGFFADQGSIELDISPPPANDNFPGTTLSGLPTFVTGTNAGATKQAGEANHAGEVGGASVWYSWTAPSSGMVAIDTCDSLFDTVLAVYTGSAVGSLTPVASNDNACARRSQVIFAATAGTVYRIAVDGDGAAIGHIDLEIRAPSPPANDNFPGATLSGLPASALGTNVDATRQAGEPNHAGQVGGASVWYSWTAPSSGQVVIDTCSGDFNTQLGIYTGSAVNSLTEVASNSDACGGRSEVSFAATAGTVYRIAVDGALGALGEVDLRINAALPLGGGGSEGGPSETPAATGERGAALKKCKTKKTKKQRKKCKRKAKRLPE